MFGGYDSHQFFNDIHILDLSTRKWSEIEAVDGQLPPARYAHTATIVGRQLLVFGGQGDDGPLNDLWIFDFETLRWMSPKLAGEPPEPRSYHSASLIGDKILIFGGKRRQKWYNDLIMLDIAERSWQPIELKAQSEGQTLAGRAYHSATLLNDNFICVFGGFNGYHMAKDLSIIDLSTFSWKTYQMYEKGCCKHSGNLAKLAKLNNREALIFIGGHDGTSFNADVKSVPVDPIYDFVSQNFPRLTNTQPVLALPEEKIDKENALVHNTNGIHVQPGMLAAHVEAIVSSMELVTQQMQLFDDDMLKSFADSLQLVLHKAQNELSVREMQRQRKKAKAGVRFGQVEVREHERGVGHASVPSDNGPALGLGPAKESDQQYADRLMRRLSSYENLRNLTRVHREEYMRQGHLNANQRAALLARSGTSRPSMELNMAETRKVKASRHEAQECTAALLISEAGLLPTSDGDLKFRQSEEWGT